MQSRGVLCGLLCAVCCVVNRRGKSRDEPYKNFLRASPRGYAPKKCMYPKTQRKHFYLQKTKLQRTTREVYVTPLPQRRSLCIWPSILPSGDRHWPSRSNEVGPAGLFSSCKQGPNGAGLRNVVCCYAFSSSLKTLFRLATYALDCPSLPSWASSPCSLSSLCKVCPKSHNHTHNTLTQPKFLHQI